MLGKECVLVFGLQNLSCSQVLAAVLSAYSPLCMGPLRYDHKAGRGHS